VVGHGIDVDRFHPTKDPAARRDRVVVGRISPAKRIEEMVEALAIASKEHGVTGNLDVIGVSGRVNREYKARLDATIARLGLGDRVRFLGAVPYDDMPDAIATYALALNFSTTALDKAVVEAMASGVPVLATNPCVREILPPDLSDRLIVEPDDRAALARAMSDLLALDDDERDALSDQLRTIVVEGHSITHLFDAITSVMVRRS
jgi:glycosyltransferase involved in cell wall biosynthesis